MSVQHRLIIPVQSRGNLGKSTTVAALGQWLDQRGIDWKGFDLDADHQSFVRLFPESVALVPLGDEPEGDLVKILRGCGDVPVTVIDPRAHLADVVLRSWEMIRFPSYFAELGGRISVMLFPSDDLEILTDIDQVVTRLGASVDYIVVKNPARSPRYRMFDGSALQSDLLGLGAVELELPVLLAWARNHLAAVEAQLGRGVRHAEAVANKEISLDGMVRMITEDWLKTLYRRFDRLAPVLLPTALSAKVRPVDVAASMSTAIRRGAKINTSNL